MRFAATAALAALLLLAACAATGPGTGAMPGAVAPRGSAIPHGPIDLGDWRRGDSQGQLQRFSAQITRRYGAGEAMTAVVSDLQRNQFACTRPPAGKRGDAPAQVCRRIIRDSGCAHTWQAHLWADPGGARLARVRGLYDRSCAKDGGLLGGPGR